MMTEVRMMLNAAFSCTTWLTSYLQYDKVIVACHASAVGVKPVGLSAGVWLHHVANVAPATSCTRRRMLGVCRCTTKHHAAHAVSAACRRCAEYRAPDRECQVCVTQELGSLPDWLHPAR